MSGEVKYVCACQPLTELLEGEVFDKFQAQPLQISERIHNGLAFGIQLERFEVSRGGEAGEDS